MMSEEELRAEVGKERLLLYYWKEKGKEKKGEGREPGSQRPAPRKSQQTLGIAPFEVLKMLPLYKLALLLWSLSPSPNLPSTCCAHNC